jgi:hypothetical protein
MLGRLAPAAAGSGWRARAATGGAHMAYVTVINEHQHLEQIVTGITT